MSRRRVGPIAGILGAGVLCGATPAPEGTEVTGALAGGRYTRTGCSGYRYNVAEGAVYGQVRGRASDHVTWSAETAVGVGTVTHVEQVEAGAKGDQEFSEGDITPATSHSVRIGVDLLYGGASLGPGLLLSDDIASATFVPSATAWLGKQDRLYAWGGVFSGPITGATTNEYARFGLGHTGERWTLEVGTNPLWGVSVDSGFRLSDRVWLGGRAYTDTPLGGSTRESVQIMGTVSYRPR